MSETTHKTIGPVTVISGDLVTLDIPGGRADLTLGELHALTHALYEIDVKLSPDGYDKDLSDHVRGQLRSIEAGIRDALEAPPNVPVEVRFKVDADRSTGAPEVHFTVPIDFSNAGSESQPSSVVSSSVGP